MTLAWTDPPADLAASRSLVNDLDLVVNANSLGGYSLHGNGGSKDYVNNVEQVCSWTLQGLSIHLPAHATPGHRVSARRMHAKQAVGSVCIWSTLLSLQCLLATGISIPGPLRLPQSLANTACKLCCTATPHPKPQTPNPTP